VGQDSGAEVQRFSISSDRIGRATRENERMIDRAVHVRVNG
jgi:hypothetical protein